MSDLVGNPEDRFSHNEAHLEIVILASAEESYPYLHLFTEFSSRSDSNQPALLVMLEILGIESIKSSKQLIFITMPFANEC